MFVECDNHYTMEYMFYYLVMQFISQIRYHDTMRPLFQASDIWIPHLSAQNEPEWFCKMHIYPFWLDPMTSGTGQCSPMIKKYISIVQL